MTFTENAKMLGVEELKEIVEEQHSNPCVERLIFLETKSPDGESKIFPCYIEAWGYDDIKPAADHKSMMFKLSITQYVHGECALIRVVVRESEIGTNKRFWDKPAKKDLRNETPWVEKEVQ